MSEAGRRLHGFTRNFLGMQEYCRLCQAHYPRLDNENKLRVRLTVERSLSSFRVVISSAVVWIIQVARGVAWCLRTTLQVEQGVVEISAGFR